MQPEMDGFEASLRLALAEGVGPVLRRALLDHFGSAAAVLRAAHRELRTVPGVGVKVASNIVRTASDPQTKDLMEFCESRGVEIVTPVSAEYPRLLEEIPDPPGVLFRRGTYLSSDAMAVAIVGTRHATAYGLQQTERLATALARAGVTIVSGLARGIDGAAHRAALAAGGRTLAVLGGGILEIYPPEHRQLADDILQRGALLGESHPQAPPKSGLFPQRNRIISGLSVGVLVVEAGDHSGALITARHALEQGRDVFALPGRVDSRMSRGCHRLLRDGAKLVESVEDILEELGPLTSPVRDGGGRSIHQPKELVLNDQERTVLECVGERSTGIDEVVATCGLAVPRVLSTLSVLEIRGLIRRLSGSQVIRI